MTDKTLEVTQEDREAAWTFRERKSDGPSKERWSSGFYDSIPIMQAFARHRIAAITAARPLIMAEAAGIAEAEAEKHVSKLGGLITRGLRESRYNTAKAIATAIRAAGERA